MMHAGDNNYHEAMAYAWALGQSISIGSAAWLYLKEVKFWLGKNNSEDWSGGWSIWDSSPQKYWAWQVYGGAI